MSDLPAGWEWATLGEIADIQGGIQKQGKRRPAESFYPFLRVANVARGSLDLAEVHEIELFGDEIDRYRLRTGDLLVVEGNGSLAQLGRAAMWKGQIADCVHQNHLIRVRPRHGVDPSYLLLAWNSAQVADQLQRVGASTSGLHTLSVSKLRTVRIPVGPEREQRRIVAALEDHLSRLEAGHASLARVVRAITQQESSILARLLIEAGGERVPVSTVLSEGLINGRSVATRDGGFPVLRLTAIRGWRINLDERKAGDWSELSARPFLVRKGDFLVSRGNGSLALVGRGGLVDSIESPVAFPDTMIRLRTDVGQLDPRFLSIVWSSLQVRRQIESKARTTAGIYKVNQAMLESIVIPVPSLSKQRAIVSEVEEMRRQTGRLAASIEAGLAQEQRLRRSLLADAFAGRLVPQDPTDEPASVLLERIRAERAAQPKPARRRKPIDPAQEILT